MVFHLFLMKIYGLYFYQIRGDKMILLDSQIDFSDVGFIYRKNAQEICSFAAFEIANGKNLNTFITVQEKGYYLNTFRCRPDCAIVIATDKDYPSRSSFNILREISSEFDQNGGNFPSSGSVVMKKAIVDYQKPANADKILRIQENLAEIQNLMVLNLEQAIARGESLNELAARSDKLSETSQLFLRDTKKLNKCCS